MLIYTKNGSEISFWIIRLCLEQMGRKWSDGVRVMSSERTVFLFYFIVYFDIVLDNAYGEKQY